MTSMTTRTTTGRSLQMSVAAVRLPVNDGSAGAAAVAVVA